VSEAVLELHDLDLQLAEAKNPGTLA